MATVPPPNLPPLPPSLKNVQPYLKTATEYDQRDPPVAYWCRFYAAQAALKLDKSSPEARAVLLGIMDWLEVAKKILKGNEAATNEIVAQAHVENAAWTLFSWADGQDRAANFNKNVVKAFYTAGLLYDTVTTFGELTEENAQHRKYAKWKAAYIHNCLKNGETPVPGPPGGEEGGEFDEYSQPPTQPQPQPPSQPQQPPSLPQVPPTGGDGGFGSMGGGFQSPYPAGGGFQSSYPSVPPAGGWDLLTGDHQPAPAPQQPHVPPAAVPRSAPAGGRSGGAASLSLDDMAKAQKYCKFASSALTYDDADTAILNLRKALTLLETGQDVG